MGAQCCCGEAALGSLVRAACLVLAGWLRGARLRRRHARRRASGLCCGCLCRALRQFAKSLQGAEPESPEGAKQAARSSSMLGPRERPPGLLLGLNSRVIMSSVIMLRSWS